MRKRMQLIEKDRVRNGSGWLDEAERSVHEIREAKSAWDERN